MKVLLVDDEGELVETLAERLMMRGINAHWATSAEEALVKADKESFDLAILDVKMPGISGITLKKLMEQRKPQMRFIFMTGHGSEADFQAGSKEAGSEYYLVKPVNIDDLIIKIKEVIVTNGEFI
ncbi:response regulator [Thermodesulfobacteriota bacterium]